MLKIAPLFIVFYLIIVNTNAQILGNEPASTKWRIIKTPLTNVIFEEGSERLAYRTASIIKTIGARDSSFIGGPAQNIPIVLHGNSVLPAGVPTLAPIRSDWTITAPQTPFMGVVLWVDLLSIHEYRHHQHMQRAKKGWFSEFSRGVLGQTGWFINILLIQPTWFFEGDATYAETLLTNGGRGRMPLFDMEYRAMRLSGMHFNYEKAIRNSRKDFVPNIYRQGYYMTTYARKYFGTDVWTKVLDDTYKKKGLFYPFTRSLKRFTGMKTPQLYEATMSELDSIWIANDQNNQIVEGDLVNEAEKRTFTSYRYPQYTKNGIIVEKSSFQDIQSYILIKSGKESKLFRPGNVTPDHANLVHNNGLLTWAENRYHPRWNLVDYGVLFSYDLTTGKRKKLTKKSRYYGPAPSSDHNSLVAIEFLKNGDQSLVILNESDGSLKHRFDNEGFGQYNYPRFSLDDQFILVGYTTDKGNTLRKYHVDTQEFEDLLPFNNQVSTRPFDTKDYVIFSGTFTGINNIYARNKTTGKIFQITSSRFGAFDATINENETKLIYSDYAAKGYNIREIDFNPQEWTAFSLDVESSIKFHEPLVDKEGGNILPNVESASYTTSKYRPTFQKLFNFHSWTPSISENEYGVEFVSNNVFNNTSATIATRYNINDKALVTTGKLTYGALFPLFNIGYGYNTRSNKLIFDENYVPTDYSWNEHNLISGVQLPFKLSMGTYNTQLNLEGGYTYKIIKEKPNEPIPFTSEFGSINAGFSFQNLQSRSRQQLIPRWGQILELNLQQNNESQNQARMFTGIGKFYFPGFNKIHSFNLKTRFIQENIKGYRYEDRFSMARGYNDRLFKNKADSEFDDIYVVSGNYEFPVIFPDWDIGSLAYIRSISVNLFYDFSSGTRNKQEMLMRSAGLDINFEIFALRLLSTSLTLRTLYRFDQPDPGMKPGYFNVIFNVLDLAF